MTLIRNLIRIILVLVVIVVALVTYLYTMGHRKADTSVNRPVPAIAAQTDLPSIERGAHLAGISCVACHSPNEDLPLSARDTAFFDAPPFGTLQPANLTPGGRLRDYSDGQLARAIREGIDLHGRPLLLMPSQAFHGMSDADLACLIGYLRSQPAVTRETRPRRIGLVLAALIATGRFPTSVQPAITAPVAQVPVGATADYGHYLSALYGCRECHGRDLHGLHPTQNGPPAGPDLVMVAHQHPYDAFERAVRHGVSTKDAHALKAEMPWAIFARMDDVEVQAIYAYLSTL